MRVYYTDNSYINFSTATHWNFESAEWVELLDDEENIVAVLNWKHVRLLKIMDETSSEVI